MALAAFASVDRSALRWLKTSDHPLTFALSSGDQRVATLSWKEAGKSLAHAETAAGTWTVKRGGFLNPLITARSAPEGRETARLTVHFNYHRIEVVGGGAYRFHRAGLLVPAWTVTTEEGREVLHVEPVRTGPHLEGGAVLAPASVVDLPDLLLLDVLSWYFIVLAWFEDRALVPLEGSDAAPPPPATGERSVA